MMTYFPYHTERIRNKLTIVSIKSSIRVSQRIELHEFSYQMALTSKLVRSYRTTELNVIQTTWQQQMKHYFFIVTSLVN